MKLTYDETRELFDQIAAAVTEVYSYFQAEPILPQLAPPAQLPELKALEEHWGRILPPSYRLALAVHNGVTYFRPPVHLLSVAGIVDGEAELQTFEEPFPALWRHIFACGPDSYDALAFDVSKECDGEWPVVQLSDEGEGERWPSFGEFLVAYRKLLAQQVEDEKRDRDGLKD